MRFTVKSQGMKCLATISNVIIHIRPDDKVAMTSRPRTQSVILWLGLNDISEVQRSLPNPSYEEFSGHCGVLKCGCSYNPAWVTPGHGRVNLAKLQMNIHLAKLQVSRKEVKVDRKNLIHSKSKQLHFNVA